MICKLTEADYPVAFCIINSAAAVYKGKIPADRWKEPYMPQQELDEEIRSGVEFYGWMESSCLTAVMGIQRVSGVTLIRHAYVLPQCQRKGLGEKLLKHLLEKVDTAEVYVGTWTAATWAVGFYQKHCFKLVSTKEKNYLLQKYWNIPKRQVETSVVLKFERQPR
jgi:GNAT superfamily N-acetyltransferase